jgi:hypothetical protein
MIYARIIAAMRRPWFWVIVVVLAYIALAAAAEIVVPGVIAALMGGA